MEFGSAFPPDGEALELVEQGEGLLHDIAELTQAPSMSRVPLREMTGRIRRLRSSCRLGLESWPLSPSSESGRRRGRPGWPATGGMPSTRAMVWVTSLTLAAVVMTLNGVPRPSQIRLVFCCPSSAGRPATDLCQLPLFRTDVGAVHAREGPAEFAGRVQLGEQDAVRLVEDLGLLPPLQTAPAHLPRSEPQLQGQELPGFVVVERVQDALQEQPVRHGPRPRRAGFGGGARVRVRGSSGDFALSPRVSGSAVQGGFPV